MRQVVYDWPVMWNPETHGPRTYFGDGTFAGTTTVTFDVRFEDHCNFLVGSANTNRKGPENLALAVAGMTPGGGSWALGSQKGKTGGVVVGEWATVVYTVGPSWTAASVHGKQLANVSHTGKAWHLQLDMDRFVDAQIDNFSMVSVR